ncbi:hypothetical protein Tco_0648376 [Tanacetum coccineum]
MSTPVIVDPESSTQADGAQSSRVPVPFPEDPYEAIRQAYLDRTDTESEPFEDPIDTKTLESPLTVAPPISLPESNPPTLVPILRRTARMAVHVPPAMSSGLSASMAEVKHYRGMSEFVDDSEEDDDEEDEEIEESLDSDSVSEDAEDEGPIVEDEDPAAGDEGLVAGVEGLGTDDKSYGLDDESHGMDDKSRSLNDEGHSVESDGLGLDEEEVVPGGQQQAAPIVGTVVSATLELGYGVLRRRELELEEDHVYSTFEVGQGFGSTPEFERLERVSAARQPTLTTWTDPEDGMVYIDVPAYPPPPAPVQTPPSPEWTSGLLPISPSPYVVPLPVSSAETEGFLTELGAQVQMQGGLIRDHAIRLEELSSALFKRSLEYEQENVATTFGVIWRPVLALESWEGQTDAQRAALWHAISDMQVENQDLRLQLAKERRARLELAEVVGSMRRGQEPRGDA